MRSDSVLASSDDDSAEQPEAALLSAGLDSAAAEPAVELEAAPQATGASRGDREYAALPLEDEQEVETEAPPEQAMQPPSQPVLQPGVFQVDAPDRPLSLWYLPCCNVANDSMCLYYTMCSHCAHGPCAHADTYAAFDAVELLDQGDGSEIDDDTVRETLADEFTAGTTCLNPNDSQCIFMRLMAVPCIACMGVTVGLGLFVPDTGFDCCTPCSACCGLLRWPLVCLLNCGQPYAATVFGLLGGYDLLFFVSRACVAYPRRRRLRERYGIPASQNLCGSDLLTKLVCWHCSVSQEHSFVRSKYLEACDRLRAARGHGE